MSGDFAALHRATRTPDAIAAELRRDFQLAFQQRTGEAVQAADPVLATLFHALAVQVGRVYAEAESSFPLAVLDDLIGVLGFPPRLADPAQTVVAFSVIDRRERLTGETQLLGYAPGGVRAGFVPDAAIELAPVKLRFAAAYENGRLTTLPGAALAEGVPLPPASAPLALGRAAPALLLAIEVDPGHLGGLGLFIDTVPTGGPLAQALQRSPWQLLDAQGLATTPGTLRGLTGRAGLQFLRWMDEPLALPDDDAMTRAVELRAGPYGGNVWIFPPVPEARRWTGGLPPAFAPAIPRLLPDGQGKALEKPLAWLQVPLPAGTAGIASGIQGIALNAVTASNIEIWSDQVFFDRTGAAVALRPEGEQGRHVMGILGVTGEHGDRYAEEGDLAAPSGAGRYRYRDGTFEFRPAKQATGRLDGYAMVRILLCDGERANGLQPGELKRIVTRLGNVTAQVTNLTVSRGGSAPPAAGDARLRFAEQLRTHDRLVTPADYEIAVRAYEPRAVAVAVRAESAVVEGRLEAIDAVRVSCRRDDFADEAIELPRLRDALERALQRRAVLGHRVRVEVAADG